jgi:hypothetical protein
MNRNLVKGMTAFALILGVSLVFSSSADAGFGLFKKLGGGCCAPEPSCGGGLFAKLKAKKCGGGLFAKLKAKHAGCCEPEPVCCEPAPEPVCCEPAPAPCCEAPVVEAPCCGEVVMEAPVEAPCCGGEVMTEAAPMEMSVSSEGFELAPGETLVPGSVMTGEAAEAAPVADDEAAVADEEAAPVAADALEEEKKMDAPVEAAEPAPAASDEISSSSDEAAPPAPTPDANTDI